MNLKNAKAVKKNLTFSIVLLFSVFFFNFWPSKKVPLDEKSILSLSDFVK